MESCKVLYGGFGDLCSQQLYKAGHSFTLAFILTRCESQPADPFSVLMCSQSLHSSTWFACHHMNPSIPDCWLLMIVRPFRLVVHWYHIRSSMLPSLISVISPAYMAQVLAKKSCFTFIPKGAEQN